MKFFTEDIKDLVRQQSQSAENQGHLSSEVLGEIYAHRLFKLFVPDSLGGKLTNLPDAIHLFEEASYIDGSFGWLVTIGAGGGYFAPIFAPEVAAVMFSPADAVVAGSGHPSGTVVDADGGYRVTGSWRYCSGASYATIFTANCMLADDTIRSFIFTPDQVSIIADWDAFGLKASASHTITVSDVFVPHHMTFDIVNGPRYYEHPVYSYPFLQFAELSFAAVNIGICRHFFELAIDSILPQLVSDAARYTYVKELIGRQQAILAEATTAFYLAAQQSWDSLVRYKTISDDLIGEVNRSAKNATTVSLLAAQRVYPYLGLGVAMEHGAINRCWRDLHTASQHILLKSFEL